MLAESMNDGIQANLTYRIARARARLKQRDRACPVEVRGELGFFEVPYEVHLSRHPAAIHTYGLDVVHQLRSANLTLLQLLQPIKHALQPTLADLRRVHANLLLGQELGREVPELLALLEVIRVGRDGVAGEAEALAGDGVGERGLVLDVLAVVLGREEVGDDAALGGDGVAADLGRGTLGDGVEGLG